MSLEERIAALTAAVEANTAAHNARGTASTSTTTDKPGKAETASKPGKAATEKQVKTTSKHDRSEMNAAVNEVKDRLGVQTAKKVIADAGYVKLGDIEEKDFDKVYDAAKALIAADDADVPAGDDGL